MQEPPQRPRPIEGDKRGCPGPGSHKTAVFGMVQRSGRVVAHTVPNVKRSTLLPKVVKRVLPSSTVFTDELLSYNGLDEHGHRYLRIQHTAKVYVSGDIHTNTIEGFWSLVKRGIGGVYHSVSAKHLQSHLNEYAWQYNQRHQPGSQFAALLRRAAS